MNNEIKIITVADYENDLQYLKEKFKERDDFLELVKVSTKNSNSVQVSIMILIKNFLLFDEFCYMDEDIFNFCEKFLLYFHNYDHDCYTSYYLSKLYFYPRYRHVDYQKAIKYALKAKGLNDEVHIILGKVYLFEEKDYQKAYIEFIKVIINKDKKSFYRLIAYYYIAYMVDNQFIETDFDLNTYYIYFKVINELEGNTLEYIYALLQLARIDLSDNYFKLYTSLSDKVYSLDYLGKAEVGLIMLKEYEYYQVDDLLQMVRQKIDMLRNLI